MAEVKFENGKIYKKAKKEENISTQSNTSQDSATSPSFKYENGKFYIRAKKGEAVGNNTSASSNANNTNEITSKAIDLLKSGLSDVRQNVSNVSKTLSNTTERNSIDYENLVNNADFEKNSQYKSTKHGEAQRDLLSGYYFDTGYDDLDYEIANKNVEALLYNDVNRGSNALEEKNYLTQMTDAQRSTYNYLYNTEGKDSANKYVNSIRSYLNKEESEVEKNTLSSMAKKNPIGMGVVSTMLYPAQQIEGIAQLITSMSGNSFDENDPLYSRGTRTRNTIRSESGDEIESKYGKAARFVYDTGSMLGDLAIESMLPISGGASAAGFGVSSQVTLNAMDRGVDSSTSTLLGTISGILTAGLKLGSLKLISTDYYNDAYSLFANNLPKILKDWKYVFKTSGNFAAASLLNDTVGIVSDTILSADKSAFNYKVNNYINDGLSEEEAYSRAITDTITDILTNAGKSAITGAIMAKINSIKNSINEISIKSNNKNNILRIEDNQQVDPTDKLIEMANDMYSEEPISDSFDVDVVETPTATELSPYDSNTHPQAPSIDDGIKLPTNPVSTKNVDTETNIEEPTIDIIDDEPIENVQDNDYNKSSNDSSGIREDIKDDILSTTGKYGGKLRIYEFFNNNTDKDSRIDFLKNEYGYYGHGNHKYTISYSPYGIDVESRPGFTNWKKNYSWGDVESAIDYAISNGTYLTDKELSEIKNNSYSEENDIPFPATDTTEEPTEVSNVYDNREKLKQYTEQMQENGKYALIMFYNNDVDIDDYAIDAREYYMAGLFGRDISTVNDRGILNDAQKQALYEAGISDKKLVQTKYGTEESTEVSKNESSVKETPTEVSKPFEHVVEKDYGPYDIKEFTGTIGQLTPDEREYLKVQYDDPKDYVTFAEKNFVLDEKKIGRYKEWLEDLYNGTKDKETRIAEIQKKYIGGITGGDNPVGQFHYKINEDGIDYSFGGYNGEDPHDAGHFSWDDIDRIINGFVNGKAYDKKEEKSWNDMSDEEKSAGLISFDTDEEYVEYAKNKILNNTGYANSAQRIYDFFKNNSNKKERAAFIKKEYGYVGLGGPNGFDLDCSPKGIDVSFGGLFGVEKHHEMHFTWPQVEKFIDEAIKNGTYLKGKEDGNEKKVHNGQGVSKTESDRSNDSGLLGGGKGGTLPESGRGKQSDSNDRKTTGSASGSSVGVNEQGAKSHGSNGDSDGSDLQLNDGFEKEPSKTESNTFITGRLDSYQVYNNNYLKNITEQMKKIAKEIDDSVSKEFDVNSGYVPRYFKAKGLYRVGYQIPNGSDKYLNKSIENLEIIKNAYRTKFDISYELKEETDTIGKSKVLYVTAYDKSFVPITKKTTEEDIETKTDIATQEKPKGNNFIITKDNFADVPTTQKTRFDANYEAIKTIKILNAENRVATPSEQKILAKYTGWGGLQPAFTNSEYRSKLSEYMTPEELKAAERGMLDEFYTNPEIITGIYNGLRSIGFNGGRILEPSSGIGRFFGAMPTDLSANVKSVIGVEINSISGSIAKYLYPNNDIRIQPFEESVIPDNYMDLVIGNVPFGEKTMVYDPDYPKHITSSIHNYFVAKSLDATKPGGIVCVLVPKGFLDSNDAKTRHYLADRADFIGAIRLPNKMFSGTSVISDIVLFKKRSVGEQYSGESFINTSEFDVDNSYITHNINEYFANNPNMMIGTPIVASTRYSYDFGLKVDDDIDIAKEIESLFKNINHSIDYKKKATEKKTKTNKVAGTIEKDKDGFKIIDEKGKKVSLDLTDKEKPILSDALDLRDTARKLLEKMRNGEDSSAERTKLNEIYDNFVKKHGNLHKPDNKKVILKDSDGAFVLSLETPHDSKGKEVIKSDVFKNDTVRSERKVTSVSNIQEGIIASINTYGRIDINGIASMLGESSEEVENQLISKELAFKRPDGNFDIPEVYLSGNVKAKLKEAEKMSTVDNSFKRNVEALKKVIPEFIKAEDIDTSIGMTWIPESVYSEFAAYMLGVPVYNTYGNNEEYSIEVKYNNVSSTYEVVLNNYRVLSSANNKNKWGTDKRKFIGDETSLFFSILNNKEIKVTKKVGDSTVLDKKETDIALHKAETIKAEFKEWIWSDEERTKKLSTLYNDMFNNIVVPKFDGSNLEIDGYSGPTLKSHQKNAIQRIILNGGNTLLAHRVGAGKTLEMICASMKLKEIGAIKKPMFVVPKNIRKQWVKDFKDAFPNSNVYEIADGALSNAEKRREELSRIANNDYDAIIVHYENFEEIPLSDDYLERFYTRQLEIIDAALESFKYQSKNFTVRRLEKMRNNYEVKLKNSMNTESKMKNMLSFEELGIDSLFVDEAHNFKNLSYITALNSSGIKDLGNQEGSNRAYDLYMKTRYLHELNGGKGLVFATATPVMNAVVEAYTMQKYLQEDLLVSKGIETFDAWVKQFGDPINTYKLKPDGISYKSELSLSRYKNMPEFMQMWSSIADVISDIKDLPDLEKLIPKLKSGKRIIVECEASQEQKAGMKDIGMRAQHPDIKGENHILALMDKGKKIAYTRKMLNPSLSIEPEGKIAKCAENVLDIYERTNSQKGTQIIFCDGGVPGGKQAEEGCNLYDEIKTILVNGGIPKEEIAYIHEADKPKDKEILFNKVKSGEIRVIIGSSAKLGTGVNIQDRAIAMHHINPVQRPGDLEQNEGRIIRQGNMFKEVEIYVYITKGSFDSRQWDAIKRKSAFIYQVMNNTFNGRGAEGDSDLTMSAAEIASIASGNPLMLELFKVNEQISKLELLESRHTKEVRQAKEELEQNKINIPYLKETISNLKSDIKKVNHVEGDDFEITLGKTTYKADKHKESGEEFVKIAKSKLNLVRVDEERFLIGKYAGFDLYVSSKGKAYLKGELQYSCEPDLDKNGNGALSRLANLVKSDISEQRLKNLEVRLESLIDNESKYKEIANSEFKEKEELIKAKLRASEIYKELEEYDRKIKDGEVDDDDFEEMYRSYISTDSYDEDEYIELAKDPVTNEKRLREIVDKYALEHGAWSEDGEPLHFYHGTPNRRFYIFDPEKSGAGWSAYGFYFTDSEKFAKDYVHGVGSVYDVYLMTDHFAFAKDYYHKITLDMVKNLLSELNISTDSNEAQTLLYDYSSNPYYSDLINGNVKKYKKEFDEMLDYIGDREVILRVERLLKGIKFTNKQLLKKISEWSGYDGVSNAREIVLFDNKKIKLADTVTYDDEGNIIPLSKRFNNNESDIRKAYVQRPKNEWNTERVGEQREDYMSLTEIFARFIKSFGLEDVTFGYVNGPKGLLGFLNPKDHGIRLKFVNDITTLTHEFGHWFDMNYGFTKDLKNMKSTLKAEFIKCFENSNLDKKGYTDKEKPGEGLAEWIKLYFRNSSVAVNDYPLIAEYVMKKLSVRDRETMEYFADEINNYLSRSRIGDTSMLHLKEDKALDLRTTKEKIADATTKFIQAMFDSNYSMRKISPEAYVLATNAAYANKIAAEIIEEGLTDINGTWIYKSLKAILAPINLSDRKTYLEFSKYLIDIHGPERLSQGKQVFADPEENDAKFMNEERAYFEKLHPEWIKVAEELFEFEDLFIQTWSVGYGLIDQETYETWKEMYPHHIPLNRVVDAVRGKGGTIKSFANQKSPHKKTSYYGSTRDIISPIDNIIDEIIRVVDVAYKNNVMLALRDTVNDKDNEIYADVISYIGTQYVPHEYSTNQIKAELDSKTQADYDSGDIDIKTFSYVEDLIESISNTYLQFESRGADISKGEISILVNGRLEMWKVNDENLLKSIVNLSPVTLGPIARVIQPTTRFMTSMITGSNPIWSIFSNAPRDPMTMLAYTDFKGVKQLGQLFGLMFKCYADGFMSNIHKGWNSNEYHKEYLAMGGGQSSLYSADKNSAKKARGNLTYKKWQKVLSNLNPLSIVECLTNAIESGPREATYVMCRKSGLSAQDAFFCSRDITVNFAMGGTVSRSLNIVFPFFNASMQGLYKFGRWISASDLNIVQSGGGGGKPPKGPNKKGSSGSDEEGNNNNVSRGKVVAGRVLWFMISSAILAGFFYLINNKDEESEEDYEQLSTYIKDNYWVIPIGDGKFISIPKPREIAVLSSAFESLFELYIGENEHAFDDFYEYALDQFLPSVIADAFKLPVNIAKDGTDQGGKETLQDMLGDAGVLGVLYNISANRDFLGRPIVSSSFNNTAAKYQYTGSTSKLAKQIGELTGISPLKIDYAFDQLLGYFQKINKALFPVDESKKDVTLGIANTYVRDNQYSTDLVNNLYDMRDKSASAYSEENTMENYIQKTMDNNMTTFYGNFNKLNKNNTDEESQRANRQNVLDMIYDYEKSDGNFDTTKAQRIVYDVSVKSGVKGLLPAVMDTEITKDVTVETANGTKKVQKVLEMTDTKYYEYQTKYNNYYYKYIESSYVSSMSTDEKVAIITKAKAYAKDSADNYMFEKYYGESATTTYDKYDGIKESDVIKYLALKQIYSKKDGNNNASKQETTEALQALVSKYGVSQETAKKLYDIAYKKDNPF